MLVGLQEVWVLDTEVKAKKKANRLGTNSSKNVNS
jgi:hypothetical protein